MKKLLNCLYVTRQGSYIHRERETIVVEHERNKVLQVPILALSGIFCFGNVLVSPFVYELCSENGVSLCFFTEYGRFTGRMQGRISGNILLRRKQYEVSQNNPAKIAANIVAAKINATRKVLLRQLRTEDNAEISHNASVMKSYLEKLKTVDDLDIIRGIEGEAAARYFGIFNELILNKDFKFGGRSRRPPLDPVNAMLSFMYAIVGKDIFSALEGVGLDPQAGFLHADRPGRDSLAQDILEEFRAWLVDRLVLTVINRKQVSLADFTTELSGAVRMGNEARKTLLSEYQARKQENVMHPITEEETPIGLLPHVQAQLLARHLRGDYDTYPPFVAR